VQWHFSRHMQIWSSENEGHAHEFAFLSLFSLSGWSDGSIRKFDRQQNKRNLSLAAPFSHIAMRLDYAARRQLKCNCNKKESCFDEKIVFLLLRFAFLMKGKKTQTPDVFLIKKFNQTFIMKNSYMRWFGISE
jgi:hypothetical protein